MSALRDALSDLPDAVFADLLEGDDAYLLVVDLPGATAETVDLRIDDRRLHVTADRGPAVPEGFEFRNQERDSSLEFELMVPPDVDADAASAEVERGVLEVELPRVTAGETTIPVE